MFAGRNILLDFLVPGRMCLRCCSGRTRICAGGISLTALNQHGNRVIRLVSSSCSAVRRTRWGRKSYRPMITKGEKAMMGMVRGWLNAWESTIALQTLVQSILNKSSDRIEQGRRMELNTEKLGCCCWKLSTAP